MQNKISSKKIFEKLLFLQSSLPVPPTSSNTLYNVKRKFSSKIIKNNFSQESIQLLADDLASFLGLQKSVKVTIGVESSEYMLAGTGTNADHVGLYKVVGGAYREIQITKKFRFELKHVVAILVHESTHNYLFQHGIRENVEMENEILTEIAAAYLGMGHLLLSGYKPFYWVKDFEFTGIGINYNRHSFCLGYVTPYTLIKAMVISTGLRQQNPKKLLSAVSFVDSLVVWFLLLPYIIKFNQNIRSEKEIKRLVEEVNEVKTLYNKACKYWDILSSKAGQRMIPLADSKIIVDFANQLATGEMELEIERIENIARELRNTYTHHKDLLNVKNRLIVKKQIIVTWKNVLARYGGSNLP